METHLQPPLTVNVLPDVATIHIFSPWSSPCYREHKNWCSSGTWVTNKATWIHRPFHKNILWNNYYWYQNLQTSMQSTLPIHISIRPISGFLGKCNDRKILKWLLRKSVLWEKKNSTEWGPKKCLVMVVIRATNFLNTISCLWNTAPQGSGSLLLVLDLYLVFEV